MSWSGVKKQTNIENIKAWCEEMGIENYTINSQGEIDVDGNVDLASNDFKELPYKFGGVNGFFDVRYCKYLTSLKNCPNYIKGNFWCYNCGVNFTKAEIQSLCKVSQDIFENYYGQFSKSKNNNCKLPTFKISRQNK